MTFLATSLLVLLAIFLVVKSRKKAAHDADSMGLNGGRALRKTASKATTKTSRKPVAPRSRWRATSILPDESACEAVKAIGGKRFLDSEKNIPKLPLPDCDTARCGCTYAHHDDRRDDTEDRRNPNALKADLYNHAGKTSRRKRKRGQRKTDWA